MLRALRAGIRILDWPWGIWGGLYICCIPLFAWIFAYKLRSHSFYHATLRQGNMTIHARKSRSPAASRASRYGSTVTTLALLRELLSGVRIPAAQTTGCCPESISRWPGRSTFPTGYLPARAAEPVSRSYASRACPTMHTAPTLDDWRRSVGADKDARRGELESSSQRSASTDPRAPCRADCDDSIPAATTDVGVARKHAGCQDCPEPHGYW
jgi:hypothetical protein